MSESTAASPERRSCPEPAWARVRTPSPENVYYSPGSAGTLPLPQSRQPVLLLMPFVSSDPPSPSTTLSTLPDFTPQNSNFYNQKEEQSGGKMGLQAFTCMEEWKTEEEVATRRLMSTTVRPVVSQGSIGHPYQCGPPCKYAMKNKCKDGMSCTHCHLCKWHSNRQIKPNKFCSRSYGSARRENVCGRNGSD
jgi:hypothetical protein